MNPISTGYKPEWGLGAVYQGINAADSEALNQEEILKNFLANQREVQMQPLDVQIKGLEAAQAGVQNTPEMLQKFVQNKAAGYDKAQRENEIGALMHPFMKEKAPIEGKTQVQQAALTKQISDIDRTLSTGLADNGLPLSPELKDDLILMREELIGRIGQTPELYGKLQVEDKRGDWDLQKTNAAGEWALKAAQARAAAGGSNVSKTYDAWIKLKPEQRLGSLEAGLRTGINPITREPMTETERIFFTGQYEQDLRDRNASINSRSQGQVTINPETKKLEPVKPVDVGSSPKGTAQNPIKLD